MVGLPRWIACLLASLGLASAAAGQARFDLPGPKIDIRVTRSGITLPLASVPNLLPGDQLWLHPDFPADQSAHYLLIASFLRGTTNPPPDSWFTRIETWDKRVREEGVTVTVPEGAEQAVLFLAPETSGDFSTLRSAVKGKPGIFVRASQDLTEAAFEQGRIEKYLAAMKQVPPGDPKALQEHSDLLARTLNLKPNPDCFKRPLDQQFNCLTQVGTQTLLDDGHALSIAAALSNGPSSDFINQASYTKIAGAGDYSAYVGAIVDLVRLTSGLHTAKYQYIPAITYPAPDPSQHPADARASLETDSLNLRLNTPPSFHDPKSVIVIGLPSVQKSTSPPLRPVDPSRISCLLDPHLALPIEGAPLVFSTAFAHDMVLHLNLPGNQARDIPLAPDAYQGGLIPEPNAPDRRELTINAATQVAVPAFSIAKPTTPAKAVQPETPGAPITGTILGFWGFDRFTGPTLTLQDSPGTGWRIVPPSHPNTIIVGQPNHLELTATGTACVQSIQLQPEDAKVEWKLASSHQSTAASDPAKPVQPQPVDLTLDLDHDASPGSIHLAVQQFGAKEPELIGTTTFSEPAKIQALSIHEGDSSAILTGASLEQVRSVTLKEWTFIPLPSSVPSQDSDTHLALAISHDTKAPNLKPGEKLAAEVHLRDGRTVPVSASILPPRPVVTILSRKMSKPTTSSIELAHSSATGDDLALGAQLVFFLKSRQPFSRADKIEIASEPEPNGSDPATPATEPLHTTLEIANGSLVLQDSHTILATFDPLKTFGPSTFGPFRLRAIAADGTAGDWIPLATIVRLPTLDSLVCPVDPAANCTLTGSGLYLIDSLALNPDFTAPTKVPEGFVDTSLAIQHPPVGIQPATLYLRLRDDPTAAQLATLSVQTDTPTPPPVRGRHGSVATPPPAPAASAAAPPIIPPSILPQPGPTSAAPVESDIKPAPPTPPQP